MSRYTETLINLRYLLLDMDWHEILSGPWLFGAILLLLGVATVEPVLTMAGTVIVVGMIAITVKAKENA